MEFPVDLKMLWKNQASWYDCPSSQYWRNIAIVNNRWKHTADACSSPSNLWTMARLFTLHMKNILKTVLQDVICCSCDLIASWYSILAFFRYVAPPTTAPPNDNACMWYAKAKLKMMIDDRNDPGGGGSRCSLCPSSSLST